MTIDNLLLKIVNFTEPAIETQIASRDSRMLRSLANSVLHHSFITENQSKLIVKILRENSEKITNFRDEILESLKSSSWSKPFRHIEQVKKFYIKKDHDGEPVLFIETSFNQEIRKILQNLAKTVVTLTTSSTVHHWSADLTEENIVFLVNALTPLEFEIDPVIQSYYETIKSWSKSEVERQFIITNIEHKNFQTAITNELGSVTAIGQNILNDRSMRYKYTTENPRNFGENLTENIANRTSTKIWIDKNQHSLSEIFTSLKELRRLPVLVVFDNVTNSRHLENLENLAKSMKNAGIDNNVGIYFRLSNDETGKKFNAIIADNQYNKRLDDTLSVAVVSSGKIPKFFIKTSWQPMSVIALDTKMGLRHGKTSVYTNCCDLIIEYAEEKSMLEGRKIL
jgi:hypothetical protein